jgi:hypothetical protein
MPTNTENVRKLAEKVGGFHVRAGAMQRAQRRIVALLEADAELPQRELEAYVAQTRSYFSSFEREARTHLKDVERRLAHIGQLQFNLTAERGVARRRIEITQSVLAALEGIHAEGA